MKRVRVGEGDKVCYPYGIKRKIQLESPEHKITSFLGYTKMCFTFQYYHKLTDEIHMTVFFGNTFFFPYKTAAMLNYPVRPTQFLII